MLPEGESPEAFGTPQATGWVMAILQLGQQAGVMLHSRGAGRWRHLGYIPREKEKEKLDCDIKAGGPEEIHSKPRAPGSSDTSQPTRQTQAEWLRKQNRSRKATFLNPAPPLPPPTVWFWKHRGSSLSRGLSVLSF